MEQGCCWLRRGCLTSDSNRHLDSGDVSNIADFQPHASCGSDFIPAGAENSGNPLANALPAKHQKESDDECHRSVKEEGVVLERCRQLVDKRLDVG